MKKLLAMMMTLLLMLNMMTMAYCEETGTFDPLLTKTMDNSAKEWFSSSDSRALLCAGIYADLLLDGANPVGDDSVDIDINEGCICARSGADIYIGYLYDDGVFLVIYNALLNTAKYNYLETTPSLYVLELAFENQFGSSYTISGTDLYDYLVLIYEALTSD